MPAAFVVSDVHGHRDDLVTGLREAGLLDDRERWSGSDAQLWVLGDLLDRGPDGIGAIDLVRGLQDQAPDQVHVLMGNHEALALGMKRFPRSRFASSWQMNGGVQRDQEALTDDHLAWLAGLPLMARVGEDLLMHSDTTDYLAWGRSVEEVNATVAAMLADPGDGPAHWEVWARLTTRQDFLDDPGAARRMLETYGGRRIVHGHSIIGMLRDIPSSEVTEPYAYADGLVLAVDGGRYDDGPLLVVPL